jgi:predicted membrane channel-forming protein YqfA (hemolysin III family)
MDYLALDRKLRREELANSLTHGLGTTLAIAALVLMVVLASLRGTARHIVGAALFGTGLVCSTSCPPSITPCRPPAPSG